ncbi:ankyrin repeat-containing domain protein [Xylaria cf. heliscus]|nr:ankyrin repeat-containing domain protein [Xylaria cf. heliscus]
MRNKRLFYYTTTERSLAYIRNAIKNNNLAILKFLLPRSPNIDRTNHRTMTVLHNVAEHGFYYTVSELVTGGADLEAKGRCRHTALIWAIDRGHEMVELLLELGADIEGRDKKFIGGWRR